MSAFSLRLDCDRLALCHEAYRQRPRNRFQCNLVMVKSERRMKGDPLDTQRFGKVWNFLALCPFAEQCAGVSPIDQRINVRVDIPLSRKKSFSANEPGPLKVLMIAR